MQLVPDFLQPLFSVLYTHPYLFIAIGMIVAGELVLLPAIYLAATGRLDLGAVIALALAATLVADLAWYYAGRKFPASALSRIPGRRSAQVVSGLERLFARKGAHLLVLSKFVYGTRTAIQVLAGVHKMPFRTYLVANSLGVLAVTGTLVVVAYSVIGTARRLDEVMQDVELAFLLFVAVVLLGYYFVGRRMRRQWFQ